MSSKKQVKNSSEKPKSHKKDQQPKKKGNAQTSQHPNAKKTKFDPNLMFDGPVNPKIYGAPENYFLEIDETTITKSQLHPGSYSHIQAISNIMNIPPKKRNQFSRNFNQNQKKILENLELLESAPTAFGKGELNPFTAIQQHDYGPTLKMGRFPVDLKENYTFPQNKDKKMSTDKKNRKEKEAKKREMLLQEDQQNYLGKQQQRHQKFFEKQEQKMQPNKQKQGNTKNFGQKNAPDSKNNQQGNKFKDKRERIFIPYEEYWSLEEVEKGLEAKKLFRGTLIINQFSIMRSFIKSVDFDCKVMFKDGRYRNRASDGAQVVFEVIDGDVEKFLLSQNSKTQAAQTKSHKIEERSEATEDELEEAEENLGDNVQDSGDQDEEEKTKGEGQVAQPGQKLKEQKEIENESDYETVDEDEEDQEEEEEEEEITYQKKRGKKEKGDKAKKPLKEENLTGKKNAGGLQGKSKNTFANREEYFNESDEELSKNMDQFMNLVKKNKLNLHDEEEDESEELDEEEEKKIDLALERQAKKLGMNIGDIDHDDEDEDEDEEEEPVIDDSVSDSDELDEEELYELYEEYHYSAKGPKKHKQPQGAGGNGTQKQEYKPKQQNYPQHKATKGNPPQKNQAPIQKGPKGKKTKEASAERTRQPKNILFAKVVYIEFDPMTSREFSACVDTAYLNKGVILAHPIDKRLSKFRVINSPEDLEVPEVGKKYYFTAKFVDWPADSNLPYAELTRLIGLSGNIDIECDALLLNYNVLNEEFTTQTYDYLKQYEAQLDPETREFVIPQAEREKRWDLTNEVILTCDPITARDLDDALSIKKFSEGVYELGVHIADVSHFVKEGTALDVDARLRTTSVYLPHMVIPMLPRLLCENLCSLNPGVERLAFTIFLYITEDGVVLDKDQYKPRIGKSIIKSVGKLHYEQVQEVITGKITKADELPIIYVPKGVDKEQIIRDILVMNKVAQKIRARRFETGSIYFEKDKNYFKLDKDNFPESYKKEQRKDSNFMVEEYMLLANQYIGKFIVSSCKEIALLRCHPPPRQARTNYVEGFLKKMNLGVEFGSSKVLQDSIDRIFRDTGVRSEFKTILKLKMIRLMEAARYFVVEYDQDPNEWRHFALNFDVYTHFTSPIRRYPDVFVHRLAEKCLKFKEDVGKYVDRLDMLALMNKCNDCKMNARKVSDGADLIFSCLWLKYNKKESKGFILEIGKNFINVYIPEFETEKKILFSDLKSFVRVHKFNPNEKLFEIEVEFQPPGKKKVLLFLKEFNSYDFFISAKEDFPIEIKVDLLVSDQNQKILLC